VRATCCESWTGSLQRWLGRGNTHERTARVDLHAPSQRCRLQSMIRNRLHRTPAGLLNMKKTKQETAAVRK